MAVDRGGLVYPIRIEDRFSKDLKSFKKHTDAATASYRKFQAVVSKGTSGGEALRKSSAELRRTADAALETARATGRLTRQEQARARGLRQLDQQSRKREASEEAATRSRRQSFRLQRQEASAARRQVRTEERITRLIDRRGERQRVLNAERERGITLSRRERQSLGVTSRAEEQQIQRTRRRANAIRALRKEQELANNSRLQQIQAEAIALRRINQARQRELVNRSLTGQGRADLISAASGRARSSRPTTPKETESILKRLNRTLHRTGNEANRVSFTFRRLFGILAAFAIAREAIAGFNSMIATLVRVSASAETAEIGIAGLITAVGQVVDLNTGQLLEGPEALAEALRISREQLNQLRVDALLTTATFEQLADTFQVALAPGLQAGLDIDQVRQFTVAISQAATAIGLSQNQLSEEIRSLLTGNISARTTRIANALGIRPSDIRRAREQGELFEFLSERFDSFGVAAELAAQTFTGLVNRLVGGFEELLRVGGVVFFDELKEFLSVVLESLISINEETGKIEVNPEALRTVALLSQGLRDAVLEAQNFFNTLNPDRINTIVGAFAGLVGQLSTIIGGALQGVADGLRDFILIGALLEQAFQGFTGVNLFDRDALRGIVRIVVRLSTLSLAISLTIGVITGAVKSLGIALSLLQITTKAIHFSWIAIRTTVGLLGFARITRDLAKIRALTLTISANFLAIFGAVAAVSFAVAQLTGALDLTNTSLGIEGAKYLEQLSALLDSATDKDFLKGIFGDDEAALRAAAKLGSELSQIDRQAEQNRETAETMGEAFAKSFEKIAGPVEELVGGIIGSAEEAAQGFLKLDDAAEEALNNANSYIINASQALKAVDEQLRQLDKTFQRSIFTTSLGGTIASGFVKQVEDGFARAEAEIFELTKDLRREIDEAAIGLLRAQSEISIATENNADAEELNALNSRLLQTQIRLRTLETSRFEISLARNATEALNLVGILRQETATNRLADAELRIQAGRARAIADAAIANDERELTVLLLQQELDLSRAQANESQRQIREQVAFLQARRATIQEQIDRTAELVEIQGELNQAQEQQISALSLAQTEIDSQIERLREKLGLEQQITAEQQRQLENELQLAILAADNPISAGAIQALADIRREAGDGFNQSLSIAKSAITQFASEASQLMVSVFDPTQETNVEERIGRFLQSIAQQIIQTLIQLATTAIILNAASSGILGGVFQNLAKAQGFHEGGEIKRSRKAVFSPAHYAKRARGLAHGGLARPSGLHHSDTIPIWAAPGEVMLNTGVVNAMGTDAALALNAGLFDPAALRAFLGLSGGPVRRMRRAASKGPGFASGGLISSQIENLGASADPSAGGAGGVPVAIMAPSQESFRRWMNDPGARDELRRVLQEEASLLRGIVS